MKSKKIALFGGSFNPPHLGHYEIARRIAKRKGIDEVWVLPVFRHPFGKKLTPFPKRFHECRKFFKGLGAKVKVKDLEKRLGGKSWTVRLVDYLQEKYPDADFSFILGGDTYRQRGLWKEYNRLRKKVRFVVFPRGPKSPIPDVSSTEIRGKNRRG